MATMTSGEHLNSTQCKFYYQHLDVQFGFVALSCKESLTPPVRDRLLINRTKLPASAGTHLPIS